MTYPTTGDTGGPSLGGAAVSRRPDQRQTGTSRAGVGPAPQNTVFIGQLVVIFGTGKDSGLFVYSGTPALGNPPVFSITTASADPYGNAVNPKAITDWGLPFLIYSGTPALGNLVAAISPFAGGTDAFGNVYPQGTNFGVWSASGALEQHWGVDASGDMFLANSAGASVIRGQSSDGSLLFYKSSGVGAGNVLISIAPVAGTDPAGNAYPAGLNVLSGNLAVTSVQAQTETLNPGPLLLYGNPSQSIVALTGSGNWTAPATVTGGTIVLIGAGGGTTATTGATIAPGGGSGGSAVGTFSVTPGNNYAYAVGQGAAGAAGGDSTFTDNSQTFTAHHGNVGTASGSGAPGGTGGAAGTGGFAGAQGGGTTGGGFAGGSGAGAAGSSGAGSVGRGGVSGAGQPGGAGGPGIIPGGKGGTGGNSGGAGAAGVFPGGGAGGNGLGTNPALAGANGTILLIYTATGGTPGLLASIAQAAGTDPATGTGYDAGIATYNTAFGTSVQMTGGTLNIANAVALASMIYSGTLNSLQLEDGAGLTGQVPINPAVDFSSFTVTQASLTQLTKAWSIPAGDAGVGAHYRITARGTGTQGTTAQALTFAASFGGLTTGTGIQVGTGVLPISDTFAWKLELNAYCVTTGSNATWWVSSEVMLRNTTVGTDVFAAAAIHTAVLTVASNAAITFEGLASWAATTGAPTITCPLSSFERVS